MVKTMGIHDGHRERMKEQFLNNGLDGFADHNVLELLLFFSIPRGDVNPLAHQLLDRFGSLSAVFDAPKEELLRVPGVGNNTATLIKLIPQMSRRYLVSRAGENEILNSSQKAGEYILPRFHGETDEVLYMICLDAKFKVLSCNCMGRGSVNSVNLSIRKIVENALLYNASSVILSHNHTSGIAIPSHEDETTTKEVAKALKMVDVELMDHIVVADDDFVSMADNGFFR
jgi:DNA repair protein RadC